MNSGAWLAPVIVALITALGAYLAVVRRASGRIATTEADSLWKEATSLREVYRAEIEHLNERRDSDRQEIGRLNGRVEAVEGRVRGLEGEKDELARRNVILEGENKMLRELNAKLTLEIESLKQRLHIVEVEQHKLTNGEAADAPA